MDKYKSLKSSHCIYSIRTLIGVDKEFSDNICKGAMGESDLLSALLSSEEVYPHKVLYQLGFFIETKAIKYIL